MIGENKSHLEEISQELDRRDKEHKTGIKGRRFYRRVVRAILYVLALICLVLSLVFLINFARLNSDLIEGHLKQGLIPKLTGGVVPLEIGKISGNLLNGVELENLTIRNPYFKTGGVLLSVSGVSLEYSLFDVFFGNLVLEKVSIKNPMLFLSRNSEGRAIWDFAAISALESVASHTSGLRRSSRENRWLEEERAQSLADRYLSHFEIRNLSVLIPAPKELVGDRIAAGLFNLPRENIQIAGIDIILRKFPQPEFTSHFLQVVLPTDPTFLTVQFSRSKKSGDFTLSMDALKQKIECAVQNLGAAGRRVTLFDGRNKDRLNINFEVARTAATPLDRIRGANGVVKLDDLKVLESFFPNGSQLFGGLEINFSSPENLPLLDSLISCKLPEALIKVPGFPKLDKIGVDFQLHRRIAEIAKMEVTIDGFSSKHGGVIDLRDLNHIVGSFSSDLAGEKMNISGGLNRTDRHSSDFNFAVERNSGFFKIFGIRDSRRGIVKYRDIGFSAGIQNKGKLWDIVPQKLLPPKWYEAMKRYSARMEIVGPIAAQGFMAMPESFSQASGTIKLDGAVLVNKLSPDDKLMLGGSLLIASNTVGLASVSFQLDSLKTEVSGIVVPGVSSSSADFYDITAQSFLVNEKPFIVNGGQIRNSFGLARNPGFDSLMIEGGKIFEANLGSALPSQNIKLKSKKARLKSGGHSWWIDNIDIAITATESWNIGHRGPKNLDLVASAKIFGFPFSLTAGVDLASSRFLSLLVKGNGSDFGTVFSALKEHPKINDLLGKNKVVVAGAFEFSLTGQGALGHPKMSGNLSFPHLNIRANEASFDLPFDISMKTVADGDYRGSLATQKAKINVRGCDFVMDKLRGNLSYSQAKSGKTNPIVFDAASRLFQTDLEIKCSFFPANQRFETLAFKAESGAVETLTEQIAKIGRFNLPFSLTGAAGAEWIASGTTAQLTSKGSVNFENLGLKIPLHMNTGKTVELNIDRISGKIGLVQPAKDLIFFALNAGKAHIFGAPVELSGRGRLESEGNKRLPLIDELQAEISGLSVAEAFKFLSSGILPVDISENFRDPIGNFSGKLSFTGSRNRYAGNGFLSLSGGGFRHPLLRQKIHDLDATLLFSRSGDKAEPAIELKNFSASFGRSKISAQSGKITDPQRKGLISLDGKLDAAYPSDILDLLAGMKLPAISFPQENPMTGRLKFSGNLAKPKLELSLDSSGMLVQYKSEGNSYNIPLAKSHVEGSFDSNSGSAVIPVCELGILKGTVKFTEARGKIINGRAASFNLAGNLNGIDIGSVFAEGAGNLKGIVGGEFHAEQSEKGVREAVFQLKFQNVVIWKIPLDQQIIDQIGLDFLEHPDFREGRVNLYLSGDEEQADRGKIRVADGLFAGPEMRLEIGNSSFDPLNLQLAAKAMFNPQPLRDTKIGKKMGKMTRLLQDKETGIPYLDLSVSGTWDKPTLMGKTITDRAKKRAKKNFIKSIFGGRRAHKASVEELMTWFPGWTKEK